MKLMLIFILIIQYLFHRSQQNHIASREPQKEIGETLKILILIIESSMKIIQRFIYPIANHLGWFSIMSIEERSIGAIF